MPEKYLSVHPEQAARLASHAGVPLREDTAFTNHKGQEKSGIRKGTEKALDKLQDALHKVLGPDEVVLYVARCQAPASAWEQMAFGWYIYYVTGTVLVFTNQRLLHFLVKGDGSWKRSLRGLSWGDVAEARVKGWFTSTLELKYRNAKKETYWRLRGGDAKKIKLLLGILLPASVGEGSAAQAMVSLCPGCVAPLTPGVYQCSACGLAFKDEKTLVRRSLLIPGGGYFYAGHTFLGVGDFIVEAILLFWVVIWILVAFGMSEPELKPGEAPATPAVALFAALFVALILAVEKWFTIHHCRRFIREFIPTA